MSPDGVVYVPSPGVVIRNDDCTVSRKGLEQYSLATVNIIACFLISLLTVAISHGHHAYIHLSMMHLQPKVYIVSYIS